MSDLNNDDYLALGYIIADSTRLESFTLKGCYVRLADAGYINGNEQSETWATPEGVQAYWKWREGPSHER